MVPSRGRSITYRCAACDESGVLAGGLHRVPAARLGDCPHGHGLMDMVRPTLTRKRGRPRWVLARLIVDGCTVYRKVRRADLHGATSAGKVPRVEV